MAGVTAARMSIKSPSFGSDGYIPREFSCKGKDINPPLALENVPEGAKSMALIVDDPDAPSGTWVHWVMWNIPPETGSIEAGSVPKGAVEGRNSWKKTGYGGPCPPSGVHHYFFRLYALDTMLTLGGGAQKGELEAAMKGHVIAKSELVGLFRK
ncbi:MAG: YbhB/YbcL family Raf kinase inhibitor-like protein [Nitrospiraceae bacterium]|nr:YbhB/YbcL family Raf kinase inhibitor-like protein [Nitrospiraceae bacterium]